MASAQATDRRQQAQSPRAQTLTVQVLAVVPTTHDTMTLVLAQPGTQRAPAPYQPGQFITLALPATQSTLYRSYSLCGDGRTEAPWEITVKRHKAGVVSNFLYTTVRPGMLLQTSLPQGRFTLPNPIWPDAPLVFVAGGSGITPIYGMLRALARLALAKRPQVQLHYAYHSPADAIYARELAALDPQRQWLTQWHYCTTNGHRLGAEQVLKTIGADARKANLYICGPNSLKRNLEMAARNSGVPAEQIHFEVFTSPTVTTTAKAGAVGATRAYIRLMDNGAVLATQSGETVLQSLERYGYRPDFSCRAGSCGTCKLRLVSGQVRNGAGNGVLTAAERSSGYILSCVAQPSGDIALATAGRPVAPVARTAGAAAAIVQARQRATKRLRIGLIAATLGLFFTVWGFTNHTPTSQASNSSNSSSSSSNSGDDGSGSSSSSSSQNQSPFGPGSISQPSQNAPNTNTGVS